MEELQADREANPSHSGPMSLQEVYGSRFVPSLCAQDDPTDGPPARISKDFIVAKKAKKMDIITGDGTKPEVKLVCQSAVTDATPGLVLSSHTTPNSKAITDVEHARTNPFHW